ncbi:MAG: hypothetical protein H0T65_04805 [Deltaproteobacteria bacterium]|nr:hypothetical protein [Deltaproteobacteria bacterium]
MKTKWWVLGSLLVSTSVAFAQPVPDDPPTEPVPEPAPPTPEPAPPPPPPPQQTMVAPPPMAPVVAPAPAGPVVLPNMLSTRPGATIDVEADYIDLDGAEDVYLFALRAHVQYLTPQGMGGYLILPGAAINGDGVDGDTQLGNIEVGGLFAIQSSPTFEALLRGGVSIDTQGDPDGEGFDLFALNLLAHFLPHPTDAFTHGGLNTTWARAQAQFVQTSNNNLRFGGMIGFDLPIAGDIEEADNLDVLINGALVAGYQDAKFGIAAGFTFIQSVSEGDDDNIKSVQLMGNMAINPAMRAYLLIGLTMDGDEFLDGTAFGLGVRAAL